MANFSLVARVGAQTLEMEQGLSKAIKSAQKFERDFVGVASSVTQQQKRMNDAFNSFSGDKVAREADAVAKAVEKAGGAARLTAQEQARVNSVLTEAIAKYNALGQQAPKSLIELEQATRKVEAATATTFPKVGLFAESFGSLEKGGRSSSVAMDVLAGTFGKFTAAGVAVSVINKLGGAIASMAERGTQIAPLQDAFERLAKGAGESSRGMLDAMGAATRGLVEDFDLMQSANKALLLGLPTTTESMATLAKTATVLGKAMGQDATKSLDDLIVALGRSSPLILDNLGLTVKVEDANRKYAESLGKTAEQLTDVEKKQAFMNEAMRKAAERVEQIGEQSLTLTEHAKTAVVSLSNIVTGAIGAVDRAAGAMITKAGKAIETFSSAFSHSFGTQNFAVEDMNEALQNFAAAAESAATPAAKVAAGIEKTAKSAAKAAPAVRKMHEETLTMVKVTEGFGLGNEAMRDWLDDIKTKLEADARAARDFADALRGANVPMRTGLTTDVLQLTEKIDLSTLKPPVLPPTFFAQMFNSKQMGAALGNSIVGAIQGGGSVFAAAAGTLGQLFTSNLANYLTAAKEAGGKAIGGFLGGAVNAVLPGLGALLGPLVGKISSKIAEAFGGPSKGELEGRGIVESFEQQLQSTLSAQTKLDAGNESWKLTTIAVRDAYIAAGRSALEAEAAVAKLWASSRSGADAARLAVLEIQAVMDIAAHKQERLNDGVTDSIEDNLDGLGDTASDAAKAIEEALKNIKIDMIHVPVQIDFPDFPQLGSGGIVKKPTLALVGEAGPEAVVPLSGSGQLNGRDKRTEAQLSSIDDRLARLPATLSRAVRDAMLLGVA